MVFFKNQDLGNVFKFFVNHLLYKAKIILLH